MSAPTPEIKNNADDWLIYDPREITSSEEDKVIVHQGRRYSAGDMPIVEQVMEINRYAEELNLRRDLRIRTLFTPEEIADIAAADKKIQEESKKVRKFSCAIL